MSPENNNFKLYPSTLFLPGDSFDTLNNQLNGRRVAGASLAKGMASLLEKNEELQIIVSNKLDIKNLNNILSMIVPESSRITIKIGLQQTRVSDIGTIYFPGPDLAYGAIYRSKFEPNTFSLTGVIHTICSKAVFHSIENLLTKPIYPWDALICTSKAGKIAVQNALEEKYSFLEHKFDLKLKRNLQPKLPLIPLAVEEPLRNLDKQSRNKIRVKARKELGLPLDSFLILSIGRMSFHSKAHPNVLYRTVAKLTDNYPASNIILIQLGSYFNKEIANSYYKLEKQFPELKVICFGGVKPASELEKSLVLSAADVFISPADNIQETFGLSVIEAMASSLPTIVSDWDGYKDLVDHAETGYLIPVNHVNYENSFFEQIDREYLLGEISYDFMIGVRSMCTVIDEGKLFHALRELLISPDKRVKMGENARIKWRDNFSWDKIDLSYRNLWEELSLIRKSFSADKTIISSYPNITNMFSKYGTNSFTAKNLISDNSSNPPEILKDKMNLSLAKKIVGNDINKLITHIQQNNSIDSRQLSKLNIPSERHMPILAMLCKLGIAKEII